MLAILKNHQQSSSVPAPAIEAENGNNLLLINFATTNV